MPPRAAVAKLKNLVLGPDYDLSLALVTNKISRHNVLSYPLSPQSGEILINKKEAVRTGYSVPELFIHGLLHLAGYDHGSRMEQREQKLWSLFTTHESSDRRRLRHRHRRHPSRRRRAR